MPLDIFSKKKEEKEKQEIIVDYREKNSLVPSELASLDCAIKFASLPIGDYISGKYIVERKTLQDLQSSIIDKRIFTQIESLKFQENSLLIIEKSENFGTLNDNSIRGFILFLVKSKFPFIMSSSSKDTAKYLLVLGKESKTSSFSFRPYKKSESKEETVSYILEGFPGLGPKTAKKLIDKFKSIKNIVNASEKDMKEVLGSKYLHFKKLIE